MNNQLCVLGEPYGNRSHYLFLVLVFGVIRQINITVNNVMLINPSAVMAA